MASGNITFRLTTLNPQGDQGNKTRLGFAGLKLTDFGSFDYGRNYGVVYDALGFTDMLPEFGGDTGNTDNFMIGRSNGLATYRNQDFFGLVDGLNVALQYQGKNENDGRSATKQTATVTAHPSIMKISQVQVSARLSQVLLLTVPMHKLTPPSAAVIKPLHGQRL